MSNNYAHVHTWKEAEKFFAGLGFTQHGAHRWNWVHPQGGVGLVTNGGKVKEGWLLTCHAIRGGKLVLDPRNRRAERPRLQPKSLLPTLKKIPPVLLRR